MQHHHLALDTLLLPHRHAARVHRHNLVVEARESPLVFGHQPRLEASLAVARHLEAHRPVLGEHRLVAGAVAVVARVLGLVGAGPVAEVVREFGAQRALDQRLLECHQGGVHRLGAHRAGDELFPFQ